MQTIPITYKQMPCIMCVYKNVFMGFLANEDGTLTTRMDHIIFPSESRCEEILAALNSEIAIGAGLEYKQTWIAKS